MSQLTEVVLLSPQYEPTQEALESAHQCVRLWEQDDPKAALNAMADRIEVVVTHSGIGIDRATVEALPKLKLVANFGVGIDTIDLAACTEHGVTVCNTPDVLTEEVADMALGLMLASIRQIPQGDRYIREGHWHKDNMALTQTVQGRRVGVVGMGRIGRAIAKRCEAFNTEIGYYGPRQKSDTSYQYFDDVTKLADWATVLIAACPGGPETVKIVSAQALKALGPEGVFVNIARGSVVDQDALVALLASGELASAGLDVFNDEPNVPQALIEMPQVVLQPHQGSASVTTRMAMGQLVVDNIAAYFARRPLVTPVNG